MKNLRRVLVVQPYGIGDLLFLTPVLRALRLIPSVERVDLLLGSRTSCVVEHNPHVDEIMNVDKDLFHSRGGLENFNAVLTLGKKLRSRRYDLLLDYSLRGEYAFFGKFFLGIKRRAGFAYKNRAFFHNVRVPLPAGFAGKHVVESVCELAEKAGVRVRGRYPEFYSSEKNREEARKLWEEKKPSGAKKYLVISPGGGESWGKDAHFKRWPARYFGEFLDELKTRLDFDCALILGSKEEKALGEEVTAHTKVPVFNLAGEIPFELSAALLERSCFFAGNDGGLLHLASALEIPSAAFYGPVDPGVYGPYPPDPRRTAIIKEDLQCRPCYKVFRYNSACEKRECLQELTPKDAIRFLEKKNFFETLTPLTAASKP
jgi:lipopolysaccharide heptosyltransferase II